MFNDKVEEKERWDVILETEEYIFQVQALLMKKTKTNIWYNKWHWAVVI